MFHKLNLLVAMTTIWTKSIYLVKEHSTNISKKNFRKISAMKQFLFPYSKDDTAIALVFMMYDGS